MANEKMIINFERGRMVIDANRIEMYDQNGRLLWFMPAERDVLLSIPKESPLLNLTSENAELHDIVDRGKVVNFEMF